MSTFTIATPASAPAAAELPARAVSGLVPLRAGARRPYLVFGIIGWGAVAVRVLAALV